MLLSNIFATRIKKPPMRKSGKINFFSDVPEKRAQKFFWENDPGAKLVLNTFKESIATRKSLFLYLGLIKTSFTLQFF